MVPSRRPTPPPARPIPDESDSECIGEPLAPVGVAGSAAVDPAAEGRRVERMPVLGEQSQELDLSQPAVFVRLQSLFRETLPHRLTIEQLPTISQEPCAVTDEMPAYPFPMTEDSDGEDKYERRRNHTVPIGKWWCDLVRDTLRSRGVTQAEMSRDLGIGEDRITNCLNRKTPSFDIVVAISKYLKLAFPVVVARSNSEALAIEKARQDFINDAKRAALEAELDTGDRTRPAPRNGDVPKRRPRTGSRP